MGEPPDPPDPCPDLDEFEAGLRDPARLTRLESHARACSSCRQRLHEMRSADAFLDRFRSGIAQAPGREAAAPGPIHIDGYEIQEIVGFGGQGAVYRARQSHTGRTVAIKVPMADTLRRASARFRFEREVELTARLDHPGIVRILGTAQLADGRIGCIMDFVEGEHISDWAIARRAEGRDGRRRIVAALAAVADAIAYAHQRAVVHRDLKPSNVVVAPDGAPRILDFGLAKALDQGVQPFNTLTGAFVGTLVYAAPEQLSASHDAIDIRTDVYALGLLLFQTLTGHLPYDPYAPAQDVIRSIREANPPRPSSFMPDLGDELDAIILRAIAKVRDRRYADAAALRDDLRAWLDGRAVNARLDSLGYRARKTLKRHRWPVAVAAISLAVLASLAALGLMLRDKASHARLADAVRDARTVESHWTRLADARAIAADSFEPGERIAWEALMDPDPVLIAEGIEGAAGPARASPAYWALWEMYQRTPILWTIPDSERAVVRPGASPGELVLLEPGTRRIHWWDVPSRALKRTLDTDLKSDPAGFWVLPSTGRPMVVLDGRVRTVDDEGGTRPWLDVQTIFIGLTHIACMVDRPVREVQCWDASTVPPTLRWRAPWPSTREPMLRFDASDRFLTVITHDGYMAMYRTDTGEPILTRNPGDEPRFVRVHSRGVPGEFLMQFHGGCAIVHADGDPAAEIDTPNPSSPLFDWARHISASADLDEFLIISDRARLTLARKSDPVGSEGERLNVIVHTAWLAPDGATANLQLLPSLRWVNFDLEPRGIRRLPFDADPSRTGSTTVFDAAFTPDSRALIVGGIDGTIRRYDVPSGRAEVLTDPPLAGGIAALAIQGDAVYAGTHDITDAPPRIVRLRSGVATDLSPPLERWVSGVVAGGEGSVWVATGNGTILRLDAETGAIRASSRAEAGGSWNTRALVRLAEFGVLLVGPIGTSAAILDEDTLAPVCPPVPMPPTYDFAVNPADPTLIASTTMDGAIILWRFTPGPEFGLQPVRTLGHHAGAVFTVAFSPDGRILASGGGSPEARDVRLWDTATGRELAALDLFEAGAFRIVFSPDGRWLAAVGEARPNALQEGGQVFLLDMAAPDHAMAGSLEYHLARFERENGREATHAAALRAWAASLPPRAPR